MSTQVAFRSSSEEVPPERVPEATSLRMGRTRQHGTAPELTVRSLLHALGHRFRVNNRDLPGSPDIANRRRRWAVFVHGCYWHQHRNCPKATVPKRNRMFWLRKFARNRRRDRDRQERLRRMGFSVIVVWECELSDLRVVGKQLNRSLAESQGTK